MKMVDVDTQVEREQRNDFKTPTFRWMCPDVSVAVTAIFEWWQQRCRLRVLM